MPRIPPHIEKNFSKKFKEVNDRIKTSFALIRKDIDSMDITLDAMRKYLKKEKKKLDYARKEDNKIRDEFRRDVDEFTQKVTQLKIALSEVRSIQKDVVVVRDLAKIEDRIRTSFKNDIEGYRESVRELHDELKESNKRIAAIENGYVREKKKAWFFKKKEE
jgi:hypothetical protein